MDLRLLNDFVSAKGLLKGSSIKIYWIHELDHSSRPTNKGQCATGLLFLIVIEISLVCSTVTQIFSHLFPRHLHGEICKESYLLVENRNSAGDVEAATHGAVCCKQQQ